jgi:iron complex outermembrane receptor protein
MRNYHKTSMKALAFSASALAFAIAGPAVAQDASEDAQEEEQIDIAEDGAEQAQPQGAITVTGSRIVRDAFTSISPLQVITTDASRNAGAFDPAQILQRDEAASGTQIDATFQGFVLNNGPGNQTFNLRGLGADRTLLLINGRRLAPAGVEGAPTAPSINLLPSSLIDRVDLLLDGASSIYGSDAVAGVGNVILRQDFDGLELFGSGNLNEQGAGHDYTVSASYGFNTDRGFFGIGAEYDYRDEIRYGDRDFLAGCDTHYEITSTGEIRTIGLDDQNDALTASGGTITQEATDCVRAGRGLSGSLISDFNRFGVLYSTPGQSNSGVPNWTESTTFFGAPVDANGDGIQDIRFADYSTNGAYPQGVFIPKQERINVMAYGEYTFPGEANLTPFFEVLFTRVDVESERTSITQIIPTVPDNNAFNPCNPNQPNGVSCFDQSFVFNFGFNPGLNIAENIRPRVGIVGDRDNFDTSMEQYRGVFGVKGDMPFVGPSWSFEVSGTYTKSTGKSVRFGVREDKLAFAIGVDPTRDFNGDGIADNDGDGLADDYDPSIRFAADPLLQAIFGYEAPIAPCDASQLANPDLAAPDLLEGCVAANLFAPSLLAFPIGDFETQAERDYIMGPRRFKTVYEQVVLSAFATGDLFELPAGPVGAVFGIEWREDKIDSRPDDVAANGLLYGFFSDRGAVGSKWIREAFAEIDIPLMADKPWVRELNLNISGRVTDEELYGTAGTYSIKGGWRPIDSLLLRMSYGTSFRAPNLRENFLLGQTGFLGLVDPCAVPTVAFVGGVYDPTRDTREQTTLDNCVREGRDPTTVGVDAVNARVFQTSSVEIARVGSLELDPETSRSITAGAAFEETFGDGWDVALNFNYYDLKIKDSVVTPGLQFAANDCFTRQDGVRSQFCDQLNVGLAPADFGLITSADLAFLNIDTDTVRGYDINAEFGKDVTLFGKQVDLGINLRANRLIERSNLFIDAAGQQTRSDFEGEFGFPKWTGRATFTAEMDNWLFTWQTRYVGDMEQDPIGIDPLTDNFRFDPDGNTSTFRGDTCTGFGSNGPNGAANPIVAGDGVFCRDIGYANDYFEHAASIRYRDDTWEFRVGITNIFDRDPPKVDCDEVALCVSNVPIGAGYNLDGREFFATVRKSF